MLKVSASNVFSGRNCLECCKCCRKYLANKVLQHSKQFQLENAFEVETS